MEKLSGPASSKTLQTTENLESSSSTHAFEVADPAAKPEMNIAKSPTPSAAAENPFTKLNVRPEASIKASTTVSNVTPVPGRMKRPRAESTEQSTTAQKRQVTAEESIEAYEDRILGSVFRITLDENRRVDASNHKLIYLPNLRKELVEENEPILFTKERLDSALLEAGSTIPHHKPILDYLLPCWKRIIKALKQLKNHADAKGTILREAKRICMSYCIFAVEMPSFFDDRPPNPTTDTLTPYLLFEASDDRGVCPNFLQEAVSRFPEDEQAKDMLTKAIAGMSYQLSNLTMNDNYKPYINVRLCVVIYPILKCS